MCPGVNGPGVNGLGCWSRKGRSSTPAQRVNALLVQVSRRLDEHEAAVDRRVTVGVGEQLEARVVCDLAESSRPHGTHPAWLVLRDRHELKVDVGEDDGVVPTE